MQTMSNQHLPPLERLRRWDAFIARIDKTFQKQTLRYSRTLPDPALENRLVTLTLEGRAAIRRLAELDIERQAA